MITLANKPSAARVWFDDDNLWLELADGRQLSVPLAYFPRLQHATPHQRTRFEMSGGGTGLHWDALDEDISVPALLSGRVDQSTVARTPRKKVAQPSTARKSTKANRRPIAAKKSRPR